MKNYFVLIFCVLLSVYVGTSCKSSSSTDGNTPSKTTTTTGDSNTQSSSNVSKEMKEKIEAAKTEKEDERVTTAMMKRSQALATTFCNCANNVNKERCEERIKRSYDATLKRLPEAKHEEFKTAYDTAVAACK